LNGIQEVVGSIPIGSTAMPAEDFGPKRFIAFRHLYIDRGLARTTVNQYAHWVKQAFRHASTEHELIPSEWYRRLADVRGIAANRTAAKEPEPVLPVEDGVIEATVRELTPTVSAMVRLQLAAGMRPGEVCHLRPCDIDRSSDVWVYRPSTHKNEHRKNHVAKDRVVMLGPVAQEILTPFLFRDPQLPCFMPSEAFEQHCERRNRNRVTPMNQGNKATHRRKQKFKLTYDASSYRVAIQRAAKRAGVPRWSPNQLRHNALTAARKVGGIETAQQIGGHTKIDTTERYAEVDRSRAVEYAKNFG
jgi:integrase